jgi:hypothetical protein
MSTRATREEQCPSWANSAPSIPGDLQREQELRVDIAACRFDIEVRERRVVRSGTRNQHVVDRCRHLVEEPLEPVEVRGVEGGDAGPELEAGPVDTVRVARRDDDRGSFFARPTGPSRARCRSCRRSREGLSGELQLATHDTRL